MSIAAFTDGVFTFNTVDLSDHVAAVTIDPAAAELDASPINSTWDRTQAGRKNYTLTVEFFDDFAAAKVHATLKAAFGTNVAFTLKPTSAAISATNPEFQGTVCCSKLPTGGAAGDLLKKSVTFKGDGALVEDITP